MRISWYNLECVLICCICVLSVLNANASDLEAEEIPGLSLRVLSHLAQQESKKYEDSDASGQNVHKPYTHISGEKERYRLDQALYILNQNDSHHEDIQSSLEIFREFRAQRNAFSLYLYAKWQISGLFQDYCIPYQPFQGIIALIDLAWNVKEKNAMCAYGRILLTGQYEKWGVLQNIPLGLMFIKRAALAGHSWSMGAIGAWQVNGMYEEHLPVNEAAGLISLRKAARLKNPNALNVLARFKIKGKWRNLRTRKKVGRGLAMMIESARLGNNQSRQDLILLTQHYLREKIGAVLVTHAAFDYLEEIGKK